MVTTTVATENALRTAIQRVLHDRARTGRFYQSRYDKDGMAVAIDPEVAKRLKPRSIAVNEISSEFQPDTRYGRKVHQVRTTWRFELHLGFDNEVTADFFEQDMIQPVPRIDATEFHTYALVRLVNTEYDHPARDGSAGGTNLIMTWEATIGR